MYTIPSLLFQCHLIDNKYFIRLDMLINIRLHSSLTMCFAVLNCCSWSIQPPGKALFLTNDIKCWVKMPHRQLTNDYNTFSSPNGGVIAFEINLNSFQKFSQYKLCVLNQAVTNKLPQLHLHVTVDSNKKMFQGKDSFVQPNYSNSKSYPNKQNIKQQYWLHVKHWLPSQQP